MAGKPEEGLAQANLRPELAARGNALRYEDQDGRAEGEMSDSLAFFVAAADADGPAPRPFGARHSIEMDAADETRADHHEEKLVPVVERTAEHGPLVPFVHALQVFEGDRVLRKIAPWD